MIRNVILDTGPLVAMLDKRDKYHDWAKAQFDRIVPPLLTCEPVICEAFHLSRKTNRNPMVLLDMIQEEAMDLEFRIEPEAKVLSTLVKRYADVPMSFADACLVRMSELYNDCRVFTLDSDFRVYRRHRRNVIPLLIPPDR